jgi:hypothetical protein
VDSTNKDAVPLVFARGALFVGSAMVVSLAVDDFGVFNDYIA